MSKPINPAIVRGGGRRELPAYLSNGLIGIRVRENPLIAGMALVCGFSGLHPIRKIEAAAVVPYPLAGNIAINGVWLSDVPHQVVVVDQAYDFGSGELLSRIRFSAAGVTAEVDILSFCCRHQPTLIVQEIAVRADAACDLQLQCLVDTSGIHGRLKARSMEMPGEAAEQFHGSLLWESEGGYAQCGIAVTSRLQGAISRREAPGGGDRSPLVAQYGFRARAGKTARLQQIVSIVPSAIHRQPDRHAERLAMLGDHYGFAALRKANRAEWNELWKGRIHLHGADRKWQQMADAAFFYMNSSVNVGSPASTSMFGLATWHDYHYYYGHVMWDIETFCVPSLMLLQPEAAQSLLEYRFRCLPAARTNAQAFGRRGLQFPWESGPSTGDEAAPSPGTAAWHEDHASLDVALAFAQFANATGDIRFTRERAWPVLSGVSEWILSRCHRSAKGFEIRRSMGIAERKNENDNEAFTMLSARAVLRTATSFAHRLGLWADPQWSKVAERLVLPLRDGMLVSHDGFRSNEEKAATPSPLMGTFPLEQELSPAISRATLEYYLGRAPDYVGSPMLSALYGVWAARLGKRALALKLLDEGYAAFVTGRFLQTLEYREDKFPEQPMAGPFFANMGGFLMSLVLGFPRLRVGADQPEHWPQGSTVLPKGWEAIEVKRLWINGQRMQLLARQGAKAVLTSL